MSTGTIDAADTITFTTGGGSTALLLGPPPPTIAKLLSVGGTTIEVQGTGQAGDSVTVYDGTAVVGTCAVAPDGTFDVLTTASVEDALSLSATETETVETLTLSGATFVGSIDSLPSSAAATFTSGVTVAKGHTYNNTSTIDVNDVVLSGGAMLLSAEGVAFDTTVNRGGLLTIGAGGIENGLVNSGVVNGAGGWIVGTPSHPIINNNVLKAAGSGAHLGLWGDVTNVGTLKAVGADALVELNSAPVTQASTGLILAYGKDAQVNLNGTTSISGGCLQTVGTGAEVNATGDNAIANAIIKTGSLIGVSDGATLSLTGQITNHGVIAVSAGADPTILALDGATVSGGELETLGSRASIETVAGSSDTLNGIALASGSTFVVAADSTLVWNGGSIASGADVVVDANAALVLQKVVTGRGTLVVTDAGSSVEIIGTFNLGTVQIGDGTVDIAKGGTESIVFQSGGAGGLTLGNALAFTGKISGFETTQFIALSSVSYGAGISDTYVPNATDPAAGGVLKVMDNGNVVAKIHFIGNHATADFVLQADSSGHVKITDPSVSHDATVNLVGVQNLHGADVHGA